MGGYFNVWHVIAQNRERHTKDVIKTERERKREKESKKVKETEGMAYM